jgi:hypothetical protein
MISRDFRLEWNGEAYKARLHKELSEAIRISAGKVRKAAVKLLNKPGQTAANALNKQKSKAFKGLNATQKNALTFSSGLKKVQGLKTVKGRKSTMRFGGSYKGASRIYWYGPPQNRWTTASAPGSPPHRQSGNLQKIVIEPSRGGLHAKVGPMEGLKYARIQELGGKGMINLPPRPYMRPAMESQQAEIMDRFEQAIQKASV